MIGLLRWLFRRRPRPNRKLSDVELLIRSRVISSFYF